MDGYGQKGQTGYALKGYAAKAGSSQGEKPSMDEYVLDITTGLYLPKKPGIVIIPPGLIIPSDEKDQKKTRIIIPTEREISDLVN